ncbi:hypothetical protein Tco_1511281, partial [Tanacetum coccineum]
MEWKIVQVEDFVSELDCASYSIYGAVEVGYFSVQKDVYLVSYATGPMEDPKLL